MKKFIAFSTILVYWLVVVQRQRRIVGVKGRKWHPEKPYGMTLIPGGSLLWVNQMMI
jgi:hypothetical protein